MNAECYNLRLRDHYTDIYVQTNAERAILHASRSLVFKWHTKISKNLLIWITYRGSGNYAEVTIYLTRYVKSRPKTGEDVYGKLITNRD